VNYGGETIGSQLTGAGIGWRAYVESMPEAGYTGCESGEYARKHNPFASFLVNGPNVVPAGANGEAFLSDLSADNLPPFVFYTPGLCNDGHDCTNPTVDASLEHLIEPVLASKWYAEDGTVIITWDEDEGEGKIATVVVSGSGCGCLFTTPGNHYGTLAAVESAYGLPLLGKAAEATPLELRPPGAPGQTGAPGAAGATGMMGAPGATG
jgi:acid phosphatase